MYAMAISEELCGNVAFNAKQHNHFHTQKKLNPKHFELFVARFI